MKTELEKIIDKIQCGTTRCGGCKYWINLSGVGCALHEVNNGKVSWPGTDGWTGQSYLKWLIEYENKNTENS